MFNLIKNIHFVLRKTVQLLMVSIYIFEYFGSVIC